MTFRASAATMALGLAAAAVGPVAADVPLSLRPMGEGAALSADVERLTARVKANELLSEESLGGAVEVDLGPVAVHGAYNDTLAEAFDAPATPGTGREVLLRWVSNGTGVAAASEAGPLSLRLAGGRAAGARAVLDAPLVAGELGWVDETCGVVLRAARNAQGERLLGGEARVSLDDSLTVALGGTRIEGTDAGTHAVGLALERDDLVRRGDAARAAARASSEGTGRVAVDYSVPVVLGELNMGLAGSAETAGGPRVYEARTGWRVRF